MWIPQPFESTQLGRELASDPFNDNIDVSVDPLPDTLRIVCMGGSVTRGLEVLPMFAYPHQLEIILNQQNDLPMNVQVLNAAKFGGTSYSGLFYFDRICRIYKPDIVTLLYAQNDGNPSTSIGLYITDRQYVETHSRIQRIKLAGKMRDFLRMQCLYFWMHRGILATSRAVSRIDQHGKPLSARFPCRVPPDDYENNLNGFIDAGEKDGFEVVLMFEGNVNTDHAKPFTEITLLYWNAFNQVAKDRDAVAIIPDRTLSLQDRPRKEFFLDDCHMTKDGLRLFAEQMAEDIIQAGVIDRAINRRIAVNSP